MGDVRAHRLLIASHSHPQITRGGAEISAYQLFREFRELQRWETWFLGCQDNPADRLGAAVTQPFSDREYIYNTGDFEWFKFANRDANFPSEFCSLLEELKPDTVNFHHFIHFGVEVFYHVRKVLPNARIILTVHEYLLICHHYGQMVTKQHQSLCYRSAPKECNKCFADIPPADFFLRELYIKSFIDIVDHFISPSKFLADRLVSWGIQKNRISVIENVIITPYSDIVPKARESGPLRVGFFGQISMLKGINVLFDAAEYFEAEGFEGIVFDIHGDYRGQPIEFQNDFLRRLKGAGRNIKFHGRYDSQRVDRLMMQVDVTIVPSIWWENSPVVIQEAFRNRRPVICSDIGGMAEKVRDGEDGWHFQAGSSTALVELLKRLSHDRTLVSGASAMIQRLDNAGDVVSAHVHLFNTLRV
jgi:glycosyltransferase involved in cell wall biosynthesis